MLVIGSLADRVGRKWTLEAGLIIFVTGSARAVFSGPANVLIGAGASIGIGGPDVHLPWRWRRGLSLQDQRQRGIGLWAGPSESGSPSDQSLEEGRSPFGGVRVPDQCPDRGPGDRAPCACPELEEAECPSARCAPPSSFYRGPVDPVPSVQTLVYPALQAGFADVPIAAALAIVAPMSSGLNHLVGAKLTTAGGLLTGLHRVLVDIGCERRAGRTRTFRRA